MGVIETKTFKSGNSVAVRLPKTLGIEPGTAVTIENIGGTLRIRPVDEPMDGKARLTQLVETLRALGPITPVGKREGIEFPDRPGLY